jgi:hypothetical protein
MTTTFDDSQHFGIFTTSPTLTSQTGKMARLSELILSALASRGMFDNLVISATAPAHGKLWLDKSSDPADFKEWDTVSSTWQVMTFDRLFGRAVVTELTNVGGTANAVTVDAPDNFIDKRLYSLTPTADNTGAATIQVAGVGTYDVKYHDGTDITARELAEGQNIVLLFTSGRFEVLVPTAAIFTAKTDAEDAADRAEAAATAIGSVVALKGTWDASTGSFPSGTIKKGYGYIVTADGTVDGVDFTANPADMVVALIDSPSTSTYAGNWIKFDFSNLVKSVAGLTGTITAAALKTALAIAALDVSGLAAVATSGSYDDLADQPTISGAPNAVLEDQKTSGTNGGTFSISSWATRTLNTKVRDPESLMTLSSNQFTPSVSGWVEFSAPAYNSGNHQARLYNVTDSTVVAYGGNEPSSASTGVQTRSVGGGAVTAGKAYRIEHKTDNGNTDDGFGHAGSLGTEIYTRVKFWRT